MDKTRCVLTRLTTFIGSMVWVMTLANCGSWTMNPASTVADDTPPQSSTVDQPEDTTPPQPADAGDDADALTFHVSRGLCCDRLTYRFAADISETSIPDEATFTWSFGDNRTKTGIRVEHTYKWSLDYLVTLTVQTPGNEVYEVARILLLSLGDEPQTVAVPDTPTDTNSPPTASDQSVSIAVQSRVVLTLAGSDADGDDLTFWIVTHPVHGTLEAIDNTAVSTATIRYTPDPGFAGTDSFTFQASDGLEDSQGATVTILPCETLKVIPWVELNYSGYDEQVIEGLLIWQKVTDTAIISTRPGRADVYTKLRERVPGMHIIPGLKPNGSGTDLLPTFDSVEGWQRVAEELDAMRATSGESRVLLENEIAMGPYRLGEESIDFDQLRAGLEHLPADMEFIWYPSIYSRSNVGQERFADVCRVVADVLDERFTDRSAETSAALEDVWLQQGRHKLENISSNATLPMLYAYSEDSGLRHWPDSEMLTALNYVRAEWGEGAEVIIYPGVDRWVEAARSLSALIPPPCSAGNP